MIDLVSQLNFMEEEEVFRVARMAGSAQSQQIANYIRRELASRLAEVNQISLALAIVELIPDDQYKVGSLVRMAHHRSEFFRFMPMVAKIEEQEARNNAFAHFIPHLSDKSQKLKVLGSLMWENLIPIISSRSRSDILADLSSCGPLLDTQSDELVTKEIMKSIRDVERWWP